MNALLDALNHVGLAVPPDSVKQHAAMAGDAMMALEHAGFVVHDVDAHGAIAMLDLGTIRGHAAAVWVMNPVARPNQKPVAVLVGNTAKKLEVVLECDRPREAVRWLRELRRSGKVVSGGKGAVA